MRTLIDAKIEKGDTLDTEETFGRSEEEDDGDNVLDLMEALRRAVEKNREKKADAKKASATRKKGA